MLGNLTGVHLIIILGVVVLLFGATRLPALSKGIAQSMRIFRNEMGSKDTKTTTTTTPPAGADPTVSKAAPVAHSTTVVNPDGSTTTTTTTTSSSNDVPPRV
jgi:sec-independent protein translocase protein TatA